MMDGRDLYSTAKYNPEALDSDDVRVAGLRLMKFESMSLVSVQRGDDGFWHVTAIVDDADLLDVIEAWT